MNVLIIFDIVMELFMYTPDMSIFIMYIFEFASEGSYVITSFLLIKVKQGLALNKEFNKYYSKISHEKLGLFKNN